MTLPTWALRLLPYAAAAIALVAVVLYIDHRGYQRSQDQNALIKAQEEATRADLKFQIELRTQAVEQDIINMIGGADANLHARLDDLDVTNKTIIQPTITKEIINDPRYTDPDGISVGVFDSLNKARAASRSTCALAATGNIDCTVPASK